MYTPNVIRKSLPIRSITRECEELLRLLFMCAKTSNMGTISILNNYWIHIQNQENDVKISVVLEGFNSVKSIPRVFIAHHKIKVLKLSQHRICNHLI